MDANQTTCSMPKATKPSRFDPCPCFSGKLYHKCCQPLHQGGAADSALALMRSRYAAYSLSLAQYIVDTTDPAGDLYQTDTQKWLREILLFSSQMTFTGLTIIDFEDGADSATVTFKAHLSAQGQDVSFSEKSQFYKHGDKWFYHSGANLQ